MKLDSCDRTVFETPYGSWFICHKEALTVDEVVRIFHELELIKE